VVCDEGDILADASCESQMENLRHLILLRVATWLANGFKDGKETLRLAS
jgi:hypothetical protein